MKINARSVHAGLSALRRARRVDARPLHLHIEPTNYCNYDCVMCVHKTAITNPAHMPLEMFERIIDEAQPWYVSLNGYGEPLMCPQFFDMVRALTRRGIRCNTTTNGSLLHNHLDEILDSGIELVSVSLDAARADTYKAVRRKDDFDRVCENVRELIQRRGSAALPQVRVCFVITRNNLDEIVPFVELAKELKVDAALFQPYIELDQDASGAPENVEGLDEAQLKRLLREAEQKARALGVSSNLDFLCKRIDEYLSVQYNRRTDPRILRRCIKPWVSAFISAEGEVRPCCSFAPFATGTGNAFESGFMPAFNDPALCAFREKLRRGDAPHWLCARCVPMSLLDTLSSPVS